MNTNKLIERCMERGLTEAQIQKVLEEVAIESLYEVEKMSDQAKRCAEGNADPNGCMNLLFRTVQMANHLTTGKEGATSPVGVALLALMNCAEAGIALGKRIVDTNAQKYGASRATTVGGVKPGM